MSPEQPLIDAFAKRGVVGILQAICRDQTLPLELRTKAAITALPFEHHKITFEQITELATNFDDGDFAALEPYTEYLFKENERLKTERRELKKAATKVISLETARAFWRRRDDQRNALGVAYVR